MNPCTFITHVQTTLDKFRIVYIQYTVPSLGDRQSKYHSKAHLLLNSALWSCVYVVSIYYAICVIEFESYSCFQILIISFIYFSADNIWGKIYVKNKNNIIVKVNNI